MLLSDVEWEMEEEEVDIEGWVCNLITPYSLNDHNVESLGPDPIITPPMVWDRVNSSETHFKVDREQSWEEPVPGSQLLSALENEDIDTIPKWIHFDSAPYFMDESIDSARMFHFGGPSSGHLFTYDYAHALGNRISYFRREWWPAGVYRLAEVYHTETAHSGAPATIPIFDDEPSVENARLIVTGRLRYPVLEQYGRRLNLSEMLLRAVGETVPANPDWVFWETPPDSVTPQTRCIHVNIQSDHVLVLHSSDEELVRVAGVTSLYRHEHWPEHVWSGKWKVLDDGTTEPMFGPDAFGRTCGREDNSTDQNPIRLEAEFDFQKWVRPRWDARATSTTGTGHIHVGIANSRWAAAARPPRDNYHIQSWSERGKTYEATYFRRATFPPGLWRRVDHFSDAVAVRYGTNTATMTVQQHPDEPGQADAEAPWFSSVLHDWVRAMEEEIGRPIYSNPAQGSPWIKGWSPEESVAIATVITPLVDGHQLFMPIGELPRIRGQNRGVNLHDDRQDYYYARKYRTGVALAFNPCSLTYAAEAEAGTERPEHALHVVLSKLESFFRDYHDPDVVEDMVDDVFERIQLRANSFQERINTEQHSIRSYQRNIDRHVKAIANLYDQQSFYRDMTKGRFRKSLESNRDLISNFGKMTLENDELVLTMDQFFIEGQAIGPLQVSMNISGNTYPIRVVALNNESQYGNAHPHIDTDGRACWGNGAEEASAMSSGADPLEFMFWTANFLKEGYHEVGSFCRIGQWSRAQVWWCENCEVEHPTGAMCPHYCQRCENHVDMESHHHCGNHGCWSEDDHDDCPGCETQNEAEPPPPNQETHLPADAASAAE